MEGPGCCREIATGDYFLQWRLLVRGCTVWITLEDQYDIYPTVSVFAEVTAIQCMDVHL
jgi:hypothetical protein